MNAKRPHAIGSAASTEALAHCDRAATIEEITNPILAGHLLRVRGAAQRGLGRWPEARATLAQALDELNAAGDPVAAAAVAFDLGLLLSWSGDEQESLSVGHAALRRLPPGPRRERCLLMALLATSRGNTNASSLGDALQAISEARTMASTLQDVGLGGATYFYEAWTQWHHGRCDAAIEAAGEAIRRLHAPVDAQGRIEMAALRLFSLHLAGRYDELEASVGDLSHGEVSRVADAVGHAGTIMCCDMASVAAFQRAGDLPGFDIWLDGCIVRWAAAGPWGHLWQVYRASILAERGDPQAALAVASRSRAAFPTSNQWSGSLDGCELWCLALLQDTDWPARYAEREHFRPRADSVPLVGQVPFALFLLLAHVVRRDLEAAAALYPVLRQILDGGFRVGLGPLQPVEGLAGLAAAAGGNWDVAEGHFRSALAFVDQIGDRLGKPSVQKWYAWMLLRRAGPGDRDQARALLDEAMPAFLTMGITLSLGHAEAMRASIDG